MENENIIPEFVLDALQDPAMRENPRFHNWIEENELNKQLFDDMLCAQEAATRLCAKHNFDIEKQWEEVQLKTSQITKEVGANDKQIAQTERKEMRVELQRRKISSQKSTKTILKAIAVAAAVALCLIVVWQNVCHWSDSDAVVQTNKQGKSLNTINLNHTGQVVLLKATAKADPITITDNRGNRKVINTDVISFATIEPEVPIEVLTLSTPRGRSIRIILSDSTQVWLNGESSLTYPSRFNTATRTVSLKGEAYFNVAHNSEQPFIVQHDGVTTRALGTAFNIRAYSGTRHHVTLVNGSVMVTDTASRKQEKLMPGEDLAFSAGLDDKVKSNVDTSEYTAWTEGLFCFDNAELADVMRELGRWYNVTVIFNDKDACQLHFSLWGERGKPLSEIVARLNQIGSVKVNLDPKNRILKVRKR